MQVVIDDEDVMIPYLRTPENCTGCARCQTSCRSKNAITINESYKPVFDTRKCATCFTWQCINSCPDHNIILVPPDQYY